MNQNNTILSSGEVEHIAELARLQLSAAEIALYREQLSDILEYVARLQTLDTAGIRPTSSVLPSRAVLREDQARPGFSREELLKNAPKVQDDQFLVPPVLE